MDTNVNTKTPHSRVEYWRIYQRNRYHTDEEYRLKRVEKAANRRLYHKQLKMNSERLKENTPLLA